jgi:hypothetical protein
VADDAAPTTNPHEENAMTTPTPKPQNKIFALVGAGIGLALFLALALLPSILYGGYAGLLLAGGIVGTPVQATFLVRALIVFGMVLGVTGVASLFAVLGAMAGAAVGALTGTVAPAKKAAAASDA